jgi:hypothetical protein
MRSRYGYIVFIFLITSPGVLQLKPPFKMDLPGLIVDYTGRMDALVECHKTAEKLQMHGISARCEDRI